MRALIPMMLWLGTGLTCAQEIFQPERIKGVPDSQLFVDLRLKIDSADCTSWTACTVQASGTHEDQPVGLKVQIKKDKPGSQAWTIRYESVGKRSDQLLTALAKLYTNIDLRQGVLWIKEKDTDYRRNVVAALSE